MQILRCSAAAAVAVLLCSSASFGGLLPADPMAFHDGAMTWSGTRAFSAGSGSSALRVTVDFAVYAPGAIATSPVLGSFADPSGGSQYVYAYQLWNDVSGGSSAVTSFSVGFADVLDSVKDNKLPANLGFVPAYPDGIPPSSWGFTFPGGGVAAQSAVWDYTSPLSQGSHSNVLIYTSPYPPEWDAASVQGGRANTQALPSPTPEPGTCSLFACAAACGIALVGMRRRREYSQLEPDSPLAP
jgi:hypothetical protein